MELRMFVLCSDTECEQFCAFFGACNLQFQEDKDRTHYTSKIYITADWSISLFALRAGPRYNSQNLIERAISKKEKDENLFFSFSPITPCTSSCPE